MITEQRVIRRAYLNNRGIAVEIDTCSLTSIVISEDSKLNRVIRIKRKLSAQVLNQNSQKIHEYKQKARIRTERDMSKEAIRSEPDAELTSDDPRKGGRLRSSDKYEAQISPPSASQKQAARDGKKKNSHLPTDREDSDEDWYEPELTDDNRENFDEEYYESELIVDNIEVSDEEYYDPESIINDTEDSD